MWAFVATVFDAPPVDGSRPLGDAVAILFGLFVAWALPVIVLMICGGIGCFKTFGVAGAGGVVAILLACAAIILVALVPLGVALEDNAAAKWGTDQVGAARLVAFGLPLVLALYAAWLVDAPEALRDARTLRYAGPGLIIALVAVAGVVSIREMARWDEEAAAEGVLQNRAEATRVEEERRAFAALTDDDPLLAWDTYVQFNLPEDVRAEALRRIALRPHLEAELSDALASENTLWVREALSLIDRVPFTPSVALEKPVRTAMAVVTAEIRQRQNAAPQTGSGDLQGDGAIDAYETSTLRSVLGAARRMTEARVDLRPSITDLEQAVTLYPTSNAAHDFPAQAAAAKARIAESLASQ